MGFCDRTYPENVIDNDTFMQYVCETVGSPWAFKDLLVMRKKTKGFFSEYPQCDWATLVRVAQWARAKRRRPAHAFQVVDYARYAWSDGAVPEMDPSNDDLALEAEIHQALEVETDSCWRERLIMSEGDGRRAVYQQWAAVH